MTAMPRPFRRIRGRSEPVASPVPLTVTAAPAELPGVAVDIPETDPLFAYLQAAPGPVVLSRLELASPALDELREAGVALVVPLVTQGELIGTLNLGPRLSEQEYSTDDRRLLVGGQFLVIPVTTEIFTETFINPADIGIAGSTLLS